MKQHDFLIEKATHERLCEMEDDLRRMIHCGVLPMDYEPMIRGVLATLQVALKGTAPKEMEIINGRHVSATCLLPIEAWRTQSSDGGPDAA